MGRSSHTAKASVVVSMEPFGTAAVQAHLEMVQGVIQRMAENSRACKLWSITVLSAVVFLAARAGVSWYTLISLVPLSLFFLLDVYYLSLERRFRGSYEAILEKLRSNKYGPEDAYRIVPAPSTFGLVLDCMRSPSVYLYYPLALVLALAVFVVQCLVD